jgi:hypothetical protein
LAGEKRRLCQTVSSTLRTIFILKAIYPIKDPHVTEMENRAGFYFFNVSGYAHGAGSSHQGGLPESAGEIGELSGGVRKHRMQE